MAAESADRVYDLAFDGAALSVQRGSTSATRPPRSRAPTGSRCPPTGGTGSSPSPTAAPGLLYKYDAETHELLGETELGLFPATMQISLDTGLLYCVNFDLHGDMTPSTVSIVDVDGMVEIEQVVTGSMPHGSRLSPDGSRHFSCAMMSDELIELDAVTLEVVRRLELTDGIRRAGGGQRGSKPGGQGEAAACSGGQAHLGPAHPTKPLAYVALNGVHQVLEVDLKA